MQETLIQAGLNEPQAAAYLLLLERSELTPPALAKELGLTRSNAYKILDGLVEFGLALREKDKKLIYKAEDPIALTDLLAVQRSRMLAMEQGIKTALSTLRPKYQNQAGSAETKTYRGSAKLPQLYEEQADQGQPVYFIASRSDIPVMGYEFMNEVRHMPALKGLQRYGLVTDTAAGPINPAIDKRTNLERTWLPDGEYDAPVEWSVAGDQVTLFIFEKEGSAIRIKSQAVAEAMRQVWHIINKHVQADPIYKQLPQKAQRKI